MKVKSATTIYFCILKYSIEGRTFFNDLLHTVERRRHALQVQMFVIDANSTFVFFSAMFVAVETNVVDFLFGSIFLWVAVLGAQRQWNDGEAKLITRFDDLGTVRWFFAG